MGSLVLTNEKLSTCKHFKGKKSKLWCCLSLEMYGNEIMSFCGHDLWLNAKVRNDFWRSQSGGIKFGDSKLGIKFGDSKLGNKIER